MTCENLKSATILWALAIAFYMVLARPTKSGEILTNLRFQLRRPGGTTFSKVLGRRPPVPKSMAYQLDVWLDPVERPEGNLQVDSGFAFGLASADAEPNPHRDGSPKIAVSVREASDRGFWSLFVDGQNISANPPGKGKSNGKRHPFSADRQEQGQQEHSSNHWIHWNDFHR